MTSAHCTDKGALPADTRPRRGLSRPHAHRTGPAFLGGAFPTACGDLRLSIGGSRPQRSASGWAFLSTPLSRGCKKPPVVGRRQTRFPRREGASAASPAGGALCAECEHPPGRLNRRRARRHSVPRDHETGSLSRTSVALSVLLDESGRTVPRVDLMPPPCPLPPWIRSNSLSTTAPQTTRFAGIP